MGYKSVLVLLILFILVSGSAASEHFGKDWERSYNSSGFDEGRSIFFANNSIYVAGISLDSKDTYRLLKYDGNGKFDWDEEISAKIWNRSYRNVIIAPYNDSIILSCTNGTFYTARYDLDGDIIWDEKWGRENTVTDIAVDDHGNIFIIGLTEGKNEENFLVLKYDINGNMEWNMTINGRGLGICSHNQSIFVSGYEGNKTKLFKMDGNGNVIWNRSYGTGILRDVVVNNSIYLLRSLSDNISLIKCDMDGNAVWVEYYDEESMGRSIVLDDNGNAFIAGAVYNTSSKDYDFLLLEYNKEGQLIREGEYNGGLEDEAWDLAINGDIVTTGYSVITKIIGMSSVMRDRDYYTIRYEVKDIPPVANFSWSPEEPDAKKDVEFMDLSHDDDGNVISWHWNFGDGTVSTLKEPTHTYKKGGFYNVNLTVFDDMGKSHSIEKSVEVKEEKPVPGFGTAVLLAAFSILLARKKIRLSF